jgi:sedoheptulokinase
MSASLGIDIGTSKVACVVLSGNGGSLFRSSRATGAELDALPSGHVEQDPKAILRTLKDCILEIPPAVRQQICAIGVTGQMHGVVLWNSLSGEVSNLVTWQDQRCLSDHFLEQLRGETSESSLSSGYGCATLSWYAKNCPEFLSKFNRAATIHDYFVSLICELPYALTDYTDAASWGLFSLSSCNWIEDKVRAAGISLELLPKIQPPGSLAGRLQTSWAKELGLKPDIPVTVAIGDNQASLYATLKDPERDLAVTVGTGAQASLAAESLQALPANLPPQLEIRPFVDGKVLVVGATLCGGKAFAWLRETIRAWCQDLEINCLDDKALYARLDELGQAHLFSPLQVCSSLQGERHNPEVRGSISNLALDNFSLGNLCAALVRNIFENLHQMFPPQMLKEKSRLVVSGNGIRRLKLAQILCAQVFNMPLLISDDEEEAASGAAKLAWRLLK